VARRPLLASRPRRNKLVTPLTSPSFIARMKELDNKFVGMKAEMYGVADKVDPIDWESYERGITNKALFQQIKREYETMTFPEIKGEDLTKINADLDFAIEKASGAAVISKQEIPKLEAQLKEAQAEKKAIHTWTMEDYFRRYPGLEEQLREEYMNAEYLPSDAEERLESQDVNEARKAFRLGTELPLPDELPKRIGDLDFEAENKKVDALLERMFGGSKQFEAFRAAEKVKEAKKAKEHHH
jgi:hypothetical protein